MPEEAPDLVSVTPLTSADKVCAWRLTRLVSLGGFDQLSALNKDFMEKLDEPEAALAMARIECHYFVNGGFFETPNQLLENIDVIRHIPTEIVQGRYDVVCPPTTAWELHKAWPEAKFNMVQNAGHFALTLRMRVH